MLNCNRFLLAVLHIKTVLSEPTPGQMAEALDHLPLSLEAAFEETMQRIRSQQGPRRKLGLDCLMWISYAKRPLTVEELGDTLAITINPSMTSMDSDYRPPKNKMFDSCHGLIIMDEESRAVRLAHYSVHEYLRCQYAQLFPEGETLIAKLCIAYQMLEPFTLGCRHEEFEIIELLHTCPFVAYAARNWVRYSCISSLASWSCR